MASKSDRMRELKILLMSNDDGMKLEDIIRITGETMTNVNRDLRAIGAVSPVYGYWKYEPSKNEIEFARAVVKFARKMN